jgi:pantoate--beta-alanine ligase
VSEQTIVPPSPVAQRPVEATGPLVARTRDELTAARASLDDGDVAVVMTMGALHEGHATLIQTARQRASHVVVTIFLNPLQFGPREDLSRYPRTFDSDMEICREAGVDLVFAPTPDVIYEDGDPGVRISAGPLGNVLEGQARPGHFDGMLTVVAKLLHLTRADSAYFGQKDAQQLVLIRRMVRDLDFPVTVVSVPTVREPDGLAMSSRNTYLTASDREVALCLSQALRAGAAAAGEGPSAVRRAARAVLVREPLALVDYLVLVHPHTLEDVPEWYRGEALLAVAGRVGTTRLIDNMPITVGPGGGALEVFSDVPSAAPKQ